MRTTISPEALSGERAMDTVRHLDSIGIRVAGTEGEARAASWIEQELRRIGLKKVLLQEFPCLTFRHGHCRLATRIGRRWKPIPTEPAAHSPSTEGKTVEADLVVLEKTPSSQREARGKLRDRAVLMYASELFRLRNLKRIMSARPAFLALVDDRFPNDWTVAIGFPRYWVDFLACPVVNVSYGDAWKMVSKGAQRVRLELDSYRRNGVSQNVIGEIPGSRSDAEVLVVSGHHDSVANNPGADDNATGVATVLELARAFSGTRPERTIRFISFGAEEQLSEGARNYALVTPDVGRIRFVLNTDSVGALMGSTGIYCTGPVELARLIEEVNRKTGFPGHLHRECSPFSDHFPLNLSGIPAVWYYRTTFLGARHYHHSRMETPEVVSSRVLETTLRHQATLLNRLIGRVSFPIPKRLTAGQTRQLRRLADEWMGPGRYRTAL